MYAYGPTPNINIPSQLEIFLFFSGENYWVQNTLNSLLKH